MKKQSVSSLFGIKALYTLKKGVFIDIFLPFSRNEKKKQEAQFVGKIHMFLFIYNAIIQFSKLYNILA